MHLALVISTATAACQGRVLEVSGAPGSGDPGQVATNIPPQSDAGSGGGDLGRPDPIYVGFEDAATDDASEADERVGLPFDAATDFANLPPREGTATGPEARTAAEVDAARASCAAAHGPAVSQIPAVAAYGVYLLGDWLLCSLTDSYAGAHYFSIRYRGDGTWQALNPDATGGLVAGVDLESTGTYAIGIGDSGASAPIFGAEPVTRWSADGRFDSYGTSFESGPLRMRVAPAGTPTVEWFVRIGQ